MNVIRQIWYFFQDQILGLKWLNALIGNGLNAIGISTEQRIGGILQFFIYDTIKIFFLLITLIALISFIIW